MGSISNVVLRGRIFHFRRRVPDSLRSRLRLNELVRSLATTDIRTAKLRACRLYLASESLFSALRAIPMLIDAQLARLVQDFYGLILEDESQGRFAHGPITNDVRERRVVQYKTMAARNREALACNRLEEAGFVTSHMLRKQGIAAADLSPAELAQARQAMLRAGIDAAEALKARYEGDFNFEPRDRLLKVQIEALAPEPKPTLRPATTAPGAPEPAEVPQVADSLSVVGAAFRTTQVATGAWDRQTAAQAGATFRLFVKVCGIGRSPPTPAKMSVASGSGSSGCRTTTGSIRVTGI